MLQFRQAVLHEEGYHLLLIERTPPVRYPRGCLCCPLCPRCTNQGGMENTPLHQSACL